MFVVCVATLLMSKLPLLVEIPVGSGMTTAEWPHKVPSPPTNEKKTRLLLYVMCAHVATEGGFLPVAVLSFSFGVFKLHGGDDRGCDMY